MRREELYLTDIVEAADAIRRFIAGKDRDDFLQDELLRSAVLHKLSIIGEAAARLPREFKDRHAAIEWRGIIGFRNIAIHAYFAVDWSIVWIAATKDAAELRQQIVQLLEQEYPAGDTEG